MHEDTRTLARHHQLSGAVLTLVMLAGLWQFVAALGNPKVFDVPSGRSDFLEGRTTQTLEKAIDRALPQRAQMIATANGVRWKLTGGTGDQVRAGHDDWLFLADEIRHYPDAARQQAARLVLLREAAQQLHARGVTLVVALVPDKARVHADAHDLPISDAVSGRYAAALAGLREAGVPTVDLLAPLQAARAGGDIVYYRSDTHWNQRGAGLAAQAIAATLKEAGVALPATAFASAASGAESERIGDLIALMGLSDAPAWLRPAGDREMPFSTQATGEAGGGDLFADEAVPVVLVGTSYSRRANFHGFLQEALVATVLNAGRDGGGFLQAASDYFTDAAFRETPPLVVIWEVPERFLPTPLDGEEGWIGRVLGGASSD